MSLIEEIARRSHEEAFASILFICNLPDLSTPFNGGVDVRWGAAQDNKLLACGLFVAGMCSEVEELTGETGLLGFNGCLFGQYELEEACMISPRDAIDHPAMTSIANREDVNRCVEEAVLEINRLLVKTDCEGASYDALRALADIFQDRYGWSCTELGFRPDELMSAISLPEEAIELLNSMRAEIGKDSS